MGINSAEEVKAAASTAIKMNVPVAMVISTFVAIIFEMIRYKSIVETLNSIMIFFKGMGHLFVITVSLIVCGQVFASGLLSVGFVDTLIEFCKMQDLEFWLLLSPFQSSLQFVLS